MGKTRKKEKKKKDTVNLVFMTPNECAIFLIIIKKSFVNKMHFQAFNSIRDLKLIFSGLYLRQKDINISHKLIKSRDRFIAKNVLSL